MRMLCLVFMVNKDGEKAADFSQDIDIIMGTFINSLGSFGSYITCSKVLNEYLVHLCKAINLFYCFTSSHSWCNLGCNRIVAAT